MLPVNKGYINKYINETTHKDTDIFYSLESFSICKDCKNNETKLLQIIFWNFKYKLVGGEMRKKRKGRQKGKIRDMYGLFKK